MTLAEVFNSWYEGELPQPTGRVHCIPKSDGGIRPLLIQNVLWNVFLTVIKHRLEEAVSYATLYGSSHQYATDATSPIDFCGNDSNGNNGDSDVSACDVHDVCDDEVDEIDAAHFQFGYTTRVRCAEAIDAVQGFCRGFRDPEIVS